MHRRKSLVSTLMVFGLTAFVVASGCGSDDDDAKPSGTGSGGSGGSGGKGGSSGSGTGGSSSGGTSSGSGGTQGSPEPTGSTCQEASDCYAGLDVSELSGPVECIDRVEDGYCTHECETDEDCCAVDGECRTGFRQVCASFENTGAKYCFLSCEDEDLVAAGGAGHGGAANVDPDEYCAREANERFICRSTGGGSENRRVCLPDGGAAGGGGAPNNPQGGAGGMPEGGSGGQGGTAP